MTDGLSRLVIIADFFALGASYDHQHEIIPNRMFERCALAGEWGLVALHVAVAKWGSDFGEKIGDPDPAGRNWTGLGAKRGKHYLDGSLAYPYGGLGICHQDGSNLKLIYELFGAPPLPAEWIGRPSKYHFNRILRSEYRDVWLTWSTNLLASWNFHFWQVSWWLDHVWSESYRRCIQNGFALKEAIMNARIRNSSTRLANRLTDMSSRDQGEAYVDYKRRHRGEKSARRAEERIKIVQRAIIIADYLREKIIPLP